MSITISDEQIKAIAEEIHGELTKQGEDYDYSLDQVTGMVENWLLRTVHDIQRSPWWHANRSEVPGQALPRFEVDLCCAYFGWSQCHRRPLPGSVFCKEHQEQEEESEL